MSSIVEADAVSMLKRDLVWYFDEPFGDSSVDARPTWSPSSPPVM